MFLGQMVSCARDRRLNVRVDWFWRAQAYSNSISISLCFEGLNLHVQRKQVQPVPSRQDYVCALRNVKQILPFFLVYA